MTFERLEAWLQDDAGASAAEFGLLVPVFALLVFGIIHLCALVYASTGLHWSVEQAARCAAVSRLNTGLGCGTTRTQTRTYAASLYKGPQITPTFSAATDTSCSGRRVSGTGTYKLRTGLVNLDVPLTATACFPADTTSTWAS